MKYFFLILIASLVTAVSLNSCNSGDDNPQNSINGTWKLKNQNGEDVSDRDTYDIYSPNGILYRYNVDCFGIAVKFTINNNSKITTENYEGLKTDATYSIKGNILTISYKGGEEIFEKTNSFPEKCAFVNDERLINTSWKLSSKSKFEFENDIYIESEDENYVNCQKSNQTLILNSDSTYQLNDFEYDGLSCKSIIDKGTWKTLGNDLILESPNFGGAIFIFSIDGSELILGGGTDENYIIQKFIKQ